MNPALAFRMRLCVAAATLFITLTAAPAARAFVDANANRLDDRIEAVNTLGWNAAFVDQDPTKRMRIGVENPLNVTYAIYVGYDHRPTSLDQTLIGATGVSMVWPFQYIDYIESRATFAQIQAILALPGVTRVEAIPVEYALNHYGSRVVRSKDSRGLSAAENYALFPSVRGNLGFDGTGIVIAILDTGVNDDVDQVNAGYPGHESLKGKFLGGGEFWCGQPLCVTANDASTNPQDHGAEASSYHATHCAGSAMGTGGVDGFFAGVAPGARLVDCKVLSDAGASVGGSPRGVEWCIANRRRLWAGLSPGSPWQGIDVLSMSLGSTECTGGSGTSTGAGSAIINTAVDSGLVVVIATGNDSAVECIASPAAADKCIAVGASAHYRTLNRADDKVTGFSNEGPRDDDGDGDHFDEYKPSVVAPGAGIISAFGDPTTDGSAYQQLSGTSMACPHVAGCVALLLQANPSLTPLQVRTILQNTAEHNVPTEKASGDRGQDPYGIDANYDPGCGWGLVDVYAATLEALNSASGVQVVQIKATAQPSLGRIDFSWVTQREYPFLGFNVYRAPDVGNAPGTFVQLNGSLIAPSGDPVIQGDDNRQVYLFQDNDPSLTLGQQYWYRVDWVDLSSVAHAEPPVPAAFGTLARVATAYYQIVHNAVDNDLLVRVGASLDYDPGSLGDAEFEVLGPGESKQDSAKVVLPPTVPANTGTSTLGTIEHFWSVGIREGDGADSFLPPRAGSAWFLKVVDGGFVNRTGRVTAFSLFVNDSAGSPSGTTYVTDHSPMPQPLVEGGAVPVTLWIPEQGTVSVAVAQFRGVWDDSHPRLVLDLLRESPGATAQVFRSRSENFGTRTAISADDLPVSGTRFEYVDEGAEAGVTQYYWVALREPGGPVIMNGPVALAAPRAETVSFARAPWPNPVSGSTTVEYVVGRGTSGASLAIHDLQGRVVRTLPAPGAGPGLQRVTWDATDDAGARVPAGRYYLKLSAGSVSRTAPVTVVR